MNATIHIPRLFAGICNIISKTGVLSVLIFGLTNISLRAGSATWLASPVSGDWNTALNWSPSTIPNGPTDTATFATSSTTSISLSDDTEVNGVVFDTGASSYTITNPGHLALTISGVGVTNNSGLTQNFVVTGVAGHYGTVLFLNSATAGRSTSWTIKGATQSSPNPGEVAFYDGSTAGNGEFVLEGSSYSGYDGAQAYFYDNSSGDHASFTVNGGDANGALGASLAIYSNSTTPMTGNYIVGGGAVEGAYGAQMSFVQSAIDVNGNLTVNGGAASGAAGGGLSYYPTPATSINGRVTLNGGTAAGASGGYMEIFPAQPVSGTSNFTINGGTVSGALGASMVCDTFDVGERTFIVNGGNGAAATGGSLLFFQTTSGAIGTLIANGGKHQGGGGVISVVGQGGGGQPRVEVFGNGSVDFSDWYSGVNAAGSIEGSGLIFLGQYNLSVGSNNLNTTFSGVLQDGGAYGGTGASLTKIGTGTLTLSGANTYTGGTTVSTGTLLVNNTRGSGTGTGRVTAGRSPLGGTGIISGAVTIGSNSGPGASLAPGNAGVGTLTIKKTLKLNKNASYNCELDSNTATADNVSARGVAINSAAQIVLSDIGTGVLTAGTVFTIINNTATTPIAGTFINLADGSTLTVGNNTFQANYEGGDGNDLTLTVVP